MVDWIRKIKTDEMRAEFGKRGIASRSKRGYLNKAQLVQRLTEVVLQTTSSFPASKPRGRHCWESFTGAGAGMDAGAGMGADAGIKDTKVLDTNDDDKDNDNNNK